MNQGGATYRNVADATWTSDDQLVVLFWDEDGYQLLPFDTTPLRAGEPVPIGTTFDPDAFGPVRFAGTTAAGQLALTTSLSDSTRLRFFAADSLSEVKELERQLPAQSTSVRIDQSGERLLYINDGSLTYANGEILHELDGDYLAAWFAE